MIAFLFERAAEGSMLGTARKVWRRTRRLFRHDLPHQGRSAEDVRAQIARRYLRGDGLEIGALHNPLAVSASARVQLASSNAIEIRFICS